MPKKLARRTTAAAEYQSFIFHIDDWQLGYSFSVRSDRYSVGPLSEHSSLVIDATCVSPAEHKGRQGQLTLLGDRSYIKPLMLPNDNDKPQLAVGGLTMRGKETSFLGSMPTDAFWGIVSALGSGALHYIYFHGMALYRGKALIQHLSFERDLNEDYVE